MNNVRNTPQTSILTLAHLQRLQLPGLRSATWVSGNLNPCCLSKPNGEGSPQVFFFPPGLQSRQKTSKAAVKVQTFGLTAQSPAEVSGGEVLDGAAGRAAGRGGREGPAAAAAGAAPGAAQRGMGEGWGGWWGGWLGGWLVAWLVGFGWSGIRVGQFHIFVEAKSSCSENSCAVFNEGLAQGRGDNQ